MGCSASNAASDLTNRAREQSAQREQLIHSIMNESIRDPFTGRMVQRDYDSAAVEAQLRQARGTLATLGHSDSADAERYGAPSPMFVNGEVYQTTEVHRESDGRIYREGVRWNGPLMSRVRVREERDGGDYTRVVAEAR
jgi:hypothetical protein